MWCVSCKINYLETAGTTEKTGTTEKFIIILMILCFAVVSFVSVVSVVSKKPSPSTTTQFLVRRGQICSIAKEDPLGIVHLVQPEGSYYLGWDKDVPLSQEIYSAGLTSSNSTLNSNASLGPMFAPAPFSPYARADGIHKVI